MYEIVMPQLSDSMDEGKLISWKKSVADTIAVGDVIAEVESDKAIMEVQSFKSGTLKELLVQKGDVVPVGQVIAKIETGLVLDNKEKEIQKKPKIEIKEKVALKSEIKPDTKAEPKRDKHKPFKNAISPKARAKASYYNIDIEKISTNTSHELLHVQDIKNYLKEHYFTSKAVKLLDEYHLDVANFTLNHKIDFTEVKAFIEENEIALPRPLSQMQKAIISNVSASAQKPVYHLYESIDAALFEKYNNYSITTWLIKIFSKVIMEHEAFRSHIKNEALIISPNANLSIAVSDEKNLYMPVVKNANNLSVNAIAKQLEVFKTKLKTNVFNLNDMQGSNFGISNLGMLGVDSFDAMINKEDAAIAAIGALNEGKISVTLTIDHRLINGYEAALFMRDVKKEVQNPLNFKD